MSNVFVRFDEEMNLIYISLSPSQAYRSQHISESFCLEIDAFDAVVGIKVLKPRVKIPFDELRRKFNVPNEVLNKVKEILYEVKSRN